MASPARGSRSGSERLPPAIQHLLAPLDEDPRLEGKGLAAAFAAAFPDLPDEVLSLAATEVASDCQLFSLAITSFPNRVSRGLSQDGVSLYLFILCSHL